MLKLYFLTCHKPWAITTLVHVQIYGVYTNWNMSIIFALADQVHFWMHFYWWKAFYDKCDSTINILYAIIFTFVLLFFLCVWVCICVCVHSMCMNMCINVCVYNYMHVCVYACACVCGVHVCACMCICGVCMNVFVHACGVCAFACTCVCMNVCVSVCWLSPFLHCQNRVNMHTNAKRQ